VIVGGVLGSISRPDVVIAGLNNAEDELHRRARFPTHARPVNSAAAVVAPARVGHPRPDEIRSQGLGDRGAEATHQGRTNRGGRGQR
jgi:hypothetical protein